MTLKTEAKLIEICDAFASGLGYGPAAEYCGVSRRTIFAWLKASNAGDEDFIVNYCGEVMQFANAMALARKMVHMEVRANLERRSMLGHDEKIFFQGMPTWVEDERCSSWTPDEREAFGFERDGLLRDERGFRVQHTTHHEPPIAAVLRVLEMSFNEEYVPSQNINVVNQDAGVLQSTPVSEKIAVPPKPVRPQLEILPPADEIDEILGPEPEPDDEDVSAETPLTPEPTAQAPAPIDPGPRVSEPTPPGYAPVVNSLIAPRSLRKLSPLEMDLLRRKDAPPEVRSAPVSPEMANR